MSFLGCASWDAGSFYCDWSTGAARCDQNQSAISWSQCKTSQLLQYWAKVCGHWHQSAYLNPASWVQNLCFYQNNTLNKHTNTNCEYNTVSRLISTKSTHQISLVSPCLLKLPATEKKKKHLSPKLQKDLSNVSGERDFTKYMFPDQHSNQPIRIANQWSFPTEFRNKLWVGLGSGVRIGLGLYFWKVMLIKEQVTLNICTRQFLWRPYDLSCYSYSFYSSIYSFFRCQLLTCMSVVKSSL